MKKLSLCFLFVILHFTLVAQSPQLTIKAVMDSAKAGFTNYKIEMKICGLEKMTQKGSSFSHDTSTTDFASLKMNDISCGEYFDCWKSGLMNSAKETKIFNRFEFSNQVFAWEKIFVFKISNWSSRGWWPEMYIVIPIKYKSFLTQLDITDIEFLSGKVVFLTEVNASYDESKLNIRRSLKDAKAVEVKGFPLEGLLQKK